MIDRPEQYKEGTRVIVINFPKDSSNYQDWVIGQRGTITRDALAERTFIQVQLDNHIHKCGELFLPTEIQIINNGMYYQYLLFKL